MSLRISRFAQQELDEQVKVSALTYECLGYYNAVEHVIIRMLKHLRIEIPSGPFSHRDETGTAAMRELLCSIDRGAMMRHQGTESEFIWATGFHCVDTLRAIGGEVVRDTVEVMSDREGIWFRLNLVFESGTIGALDVLPTCGCVDESYDIFGNGFRPEVRVASSAQSGIRLWRDGKLVADQCLPYDLPAFLRGGTFAETEEFIQALMEGRPPRPSVEDALPSAEICFAAARGASNFQMDEH